MNKKILGLGAATLAFAAIPVIGVNAADGDVLNVTDNITLTVSESCTLGISGEGATVDLGTVTGKTTEALEKAGSTFKVVCNNGNGWTLTAEGAGTSGHETELYNETAQHGIVTGTDTSGGTVSNWAFKLTGTGIASGYEANAAIPTSPTTVAEQSQAAAEDTINITYSVGVDGDAPAGTYKGAVKYTLAAKGGA